MAHADNCARELTLSAARDGLVDLRVSAPCEPFARVDIAYGPFIVTEETSGTGTVDLRLPRIAVLPSAAAQISGTVLFASLPETGERAADYIALVWPGTVELSLSLPEGVGSQPLSLGFPLGAEARRAEVVILRLDDEAPAFVDIAVSSAVCSEAPINAALLISDRDARLPVVLPLQSCEGSDGFVRLTLPPPPA